MQTFEPKPAHSRPALVVHFSDDTLLVALNVSLFCSAEWRAKTASLPSPDHWEFMHSLTIQDAADADIILRHALLLQPDDLTHILSTRQFADGALPLMQSAWGATRSLVTLPEPSFAEAVVRGIAVNGWKIVLATGAAWAFVVLVLGAGGTR